jgi:ribosomal protein L15
LFRREIEEWIWGSGTGKSGGMGNCGQDVMYKTKIKYLKEE